jgi:hypothetical protein
MSKRYKVWVHVEETEEVPGEEDKYTDVGMPEQVFVSEKLDDAREIATAIVNLMHTMNDCIG